MEEELKKLAQRLITYAQNIVDGNILACKKHKWACQKFLDDLEKSHDEDYPYEFDIFEVYKVNEWAKLFKHSKPITKMDDLRIHLVDFQLFIVGNIFGWKHKKTGYRRYSKSYIQLARKQAKSQLLSIITSYETFNSPDKAECYIAGWGREQSNFVYKEIETQLKNCDFLEGKWSNSYHRITHLKSGSTILALSKEGRSLDGANPKFVVIDEYHVHKSDEIYQVMESGMVHPDAHICVITTAGFNLNSACYKTYEYVSKVINPDDTGYTNENYFIFIAEMEEDDDIKNPDLYIKANPLLATFEEGMNSLKEKLEIAIMMGGDKLRDFLTKNCNKWVMMRKEGFLDMARWNKCYEEFSLEDMRGLKCIAGIDLSSKIDLTSVSFIFSKDDNIYIHNHSFMPEETLKQKMNTDKVPYDMWIQEGYATALEGDVIDYRYIKKYIQDLEKEYDLHILEICIDAWNDAYFIASMSEEGYECIEVRQGIMTLGLPTKEFRDRVYSGRIKHNNNKLYSWSVSNAVTKSDINGNIMLDKSKSFERIDPIASTINAMVRVTVLEGIGQNDLNDYILSDDWSF